ncbi:branched-chain amino acid transport system II carrier protein [Brevibacillus sp. GCM10020057]|uniref:branched-chain amino acid transport system II carrier protein n=1 Tax=Brevibacillus sp. GCM10020057 TaxID=3317327 RepID=UPI00362B5AB4
MTKLSKRESIWISFMLFSMFFGAGNLIFPPFLGQSAGHDVWVALVGFILSAVGLPILGVMAVAKAGTFYDLANRVHPIFALLFPFLIYVSIGPGLAIPRAGSLAFEMGMAPFMPDEWAVSPVSLLMYTIVFFGIVFWLSLSPSKLVDRFGKWLTPALLTLIALIFVKSLFTPMGPLAKPADAYASAPVIKGFLEGYMTMDALAALVFGIVIANTLRNKGMSEPRALSKAMIKAGVGAGILLTIIYVILGVLGAQSSFLGVSENGAQILTGLMNHLFGSSGTFLLGIVFTIACLCVSIGLVTSCSQYFQGLFGHLSYRVWVTILCLLSMAIANLGLNQILSVSVPILGAIYPVAIVLIVLALLGQLIPPNSRVYVVTVVVVAIFGIIDMVNVTFLQHQWDFWLNALPFYAEGAGWIMPALVAGLAGTLLDFGKKSSSVYKKGPMTE